MFTMPNHRQHRPWRFASDLDTGSPVFDILIQCRFGQEAFDHNLIDKRRVEDGRNADPLNTNSAQCLPAATSRP